MPDEIHDELDDLLSDWADEFNMPKTQIVNTIERQYGLDIAEVDGEDAEQFAEAFRNADAEKAGEILREYDVPEDEIEQFESQIAQVDGLGDDTGNSDPEPSTNGQSAETPSDSRSQTDGLTPAQRKEVADLVEQSTPTADEIVARLEEKMGGGGGQQTQGQAQGQGNQEMQSMLAKALAQKFLQDGGSSGMAQLGEKFQKAAMNDYLKRLSQPSIEDMVGMKIREDIADEYADEYRDEIFDSDPMEEVEDLESDDDDGWSFL